MEMLPLIINLVSGAAGGNIVGALFKNLSLGGVGNSLAGVLGGGLGGSILGSLGMGAVGGDSSMGGILGSVLGGGAGGGVLMTIIGFVKRMMAK